MLKKFNALCESLKKVFTQKEMSANFSELIYDKGEYYVLNDEQTKLKNQTQSDKKTFFNALIMTVPITFQLKSGEEVTVMPDMYLAVIGSLMDGDEIFIVTKEELNDYRIIPKQYCPICKERKIGSCRCSGPHTMEQLKKGHGNKCKNNHRWSGELSYDASKD